MDACIIRKGELADYEGVEVIMQEVHGLHLGWRPDNYKAAETIYPRAYFEKLVAAKQILVAEQNGKIVGHLTFNYRHVDSDKFLKQDVIFVDDLAVKEEYRGHGIGTRLLNTVKKKVQEENLNGLERCMNTMALQRNPLTWSYCKRTCFSSQGELILT